MHLISWLTCCNTVLFTKSYTSIMHAVSSEQCSIIAIQPSIFAAAYQIQGPWAVEVGGGWLAPIPAVKGREANFGTMNPAFA